MKKNGKGDILDNSNSGMKASKEGQGGMLDESPVDAPPPIPAIFRSDRELNLNVEPGMPWKEDDNVRSLDDTPDDALAEFAPLTKTSVRSSLIEGGIGLSKKGDKYVTIPKEGGPDQQRTGA